MYTTIIIETFEYSIKILVIALGIASVALTPSLIISKSVDALGWCESQNKPSNWVYGCQSGWYDHCNPYIPGNDKGYTEGYKVG